MTRTVCTYITRAHSIPYKDAGCSLRSDSGRHRSTWDRAWRRSDNGPVGAGLLLGASDRFSAGEVYGVESGKYRPTSAVTVDEEDQPPAIRTDPSARSVAVCRDRASDIVPIGSKNSLP